MTSQKESIIELAVKEGGKPWMDTQIEVDRAIQGVHLAINEIENLSAQILRDQHKIIWNDTK